MRQMRFVAVLMVMALAAGTLAMAQAPGKAPVPGPEHKRLGMFVGKWAGSGEMKPSAMGPGGKTSWTETCAWESGNFAIVCHTEMTDASGTTKGMSMMTYNAEEKRYVLLGVNSVGMVDQSTGSVQGKVWNWSGEGKIQGKLMKSRFSITEVSNDTYNFKFDMSQDGGKTWANVMEGKSTRAK